MKPAVLTALAAIAAATGASAQEPERRPASDHDCPYLFHRIGGKEQMYGGVVMDYGSARVGRPAGTALQPRCDRVDRQYSRIRDVFEVRGASRQLAIAVNDDPEPDNVHVYLRNGTFIALPSHPLHDLYFPTRRDPRVGAYGCKPARWIRARLTERPPPIGTDFFVQTANGRLTVTVEATTVVRGADRVAGHPILRRGDRLRLKATPCSGGNHRGTVVQRIHVR